MKGDINFQWIKSEIGFWTKIPLRAPDYQHLLPELHYPIGGAATFIRLYYQFPVMALPGRDEKEVFN